MVRRRVGAAPNSASRLAVVRTTPPCPSSIEEEGTLITDVAECGSARSTPKEKGRDPAIPPSIFVSLWASDLEVHVAHAAHATAGHAARAAAALLGGFDDGGFRGDHQAGDRGRVLQGGADHLGRVDDTGLD